MTNKKINDVIWIKNDSQYMSASQSNIAAVKGLLDSTGPGFCLAKFTQVTMHLGSGTVHSCHHPRTHKIPLDELENNPSALFNTNHLKAVRKEMLDGGKPSECEYCWRIEKNDGNSDRYYKSLEPWALSKHDDIIDPDMNYYPTYLEVDFSNACNFSCIYCGPEFSSKWVERLKQDGPIKLLEGTKNVQWAQGWQDLDSLQIKNKDVNPYIDAFWKWFPEAYKKLSVYRITGGEPLLSKETFRSIDWLIENPNVDLEFSINSNLGVPEKIWKRFIDKIKILATGKYVKKLTIFTSVDGWGERAEYMRPGLDFELFRSRYEQLLEIGNIRCVVMCAFNILSMSSIKELFQWQLKLKQKYNIDHSMAALEEKTGFKLVNGDGVSYRDRTKKNPDQIAVVGIDTPYVRHPTYLDASISTTGLVEQYLLPAMSYISGHETARHWEIHQGFEEHEVEKFRRIVNDRLYFSNPNNSKDNEYWLIVERAKFYDFVNEIDRRSGKRFLDIFPEMEDFYENCAQAKKTVEDKNNEK